MQTLSRQQNIVFLLFAVVFVSVFIFLDAGSSRNDPDTFWHIELGKEMLRQGKVLDTAIHTFAGDNLPYVPHEAGFQLIAGALYEAGGWAGLHLLTLLSVFMLTWGLYRLMEVSRQEADLPRMHPLLGFLVLPCLVFFVYYAYFNIRPQMISAGLVVWFAVWLRRFAMGADVRKAAALGIISLILANVHTGVWPVIAVLLGMQTAERIWLKKLNRYDAIAMLLVVLGGLANFGGWKSLTYFVTLSDSPFTALILEWRPVAFSSNFPAFAIVVLFILCAMYSLRDKPLRPFRLMLFIGMMYLGLASYKQFLFLILFLPYYLAVVVDRFKRLAVFRNPEAYTRIKVVLPLLALGLMINFSTEMFAKYEQPVTQYPVEEMDYILKMNDSGKRPKVLSTYDASGYVMFRGGDVLADGRFDPFILDSTKGVQGWTAFERSYNGFRSGYLMDVIRADRPDFLILPLSDPKETVNSLKKVEQEDVRKQLREPDFTGSFGEVWDLRAFGGDR
ncbi:hypothetical protein E5161_16435 [Cohnella pontilimi]|uniref:Glycosyltransferase RgtA/B/C/D-like domain-containing protein n=1 Tax=Cohnella pontilimi TaxID=2564100 RepID=A0A4U0F9H3_9BACL|nr:hypothetical protein [Cohnella pontilimi]TJY40734.1 hypothetical protein E5161_16435 [Cohnella pontilimi]